MTNNTRCPDCIKLPEWQWTLFTEADDFCEAHVWRRYPAIPVTDEEIWEARKAQSEDEYGWDAPLHLYFPDGLRRCRACGYEWIGFPNENSHLCPIGMDGEMVYGPYLPNRLNVWEDDCYALPAYVGMRKRLH